MLNCILIDDEPLALRQLRYYAEQVDRLNVLATFRNAIEARGYMMAEQRDSVDLIFCDINMPELSGVDFVRELQESQREGEAVPMVIFTTAHAEYAVEGFRLDAVDYLLKPFSSGDFERSVLRANSLHELRYGRTPQGESEQPATIETLDQAEQMNEYISVRADYKVTMVRLSEIRYMESEGEYVRMHIEGRRPITTLCRLKNMEAQLPSQSFVRIHRSYIVNISRIESYDRSRVYMNSDEYLPIGQNYRAMFLACMEQREVLLRV